jgi:quercetin dioxygenase-like cupin family protein
LLLGSSHVDRPGAEEIAMAVLVSTIDNPVQMIGIHGGQGSIYWKCFARLHMLHADVVAFEYVKLSPGSAVGDHVHSRTEEIYFIVSGEGEMRVGDERQNVGPGDLILTPQGTKHGLVGKPGETIEFVVAEVLPPGITAVLPAYAPEA